MYMCTHTRTLRILDYLVHTTYTGCNQSVACAYAHHVLTYLYICTDTYVHIVQTKEGRDRETNRKQ